MVPVVSAEDGSWLLPEPLRPLMKPGGHGAIWKLMLDEGVFTWLRNRRREAAIVRQIRLAGHQFLHTCCPTFLQLSMQTICKCSMAAVLLQLCMRVT